MAEKVYALAVFTPRQAWWQLSEKERQSFIEQNRKLWQEVGAQMLADLRTGSSRWRAVHLVAYPDMEAYHKYMDGVSPDGLNSQRYFEFDTTLCFELPGRPPAATA